MGMNDPAYPMHGFNKGLTKRELFAAMAMQGLLTCFADNHKVAEMAVKQADALIERLAAGPVAGVNDGK